MRAFGVLWLRCTFHCHLQEQVYLFLFFGFFFSRTARRKRLTRWRSYRCGTWWNFVASRHSGWYVCEMAHSSSCSNLGNSQGRGPLLEITHKGYKYRCRVYNRRESLPYESYSEQKELRISYRGTALKHLGRTKQCSSWNTFNPAM
jgi:hypothetical protein